MKNSLYTYLDNHVPGRWQIGFRRLLSYFNWAKPVDHKLVELRKKINAPADFAYVTYYQTHSESFASLGQGDTFNFSEEENNYLTLMNPPPPPVSTALMALNPENESIKIQIELEKTKMANTKAANACLAALLKLTPENRENTIPGLLKDLTQPVLISLIRKWLSHDQTKKEPNSWLNHNLIDIINEQFAADIKETVFGNLNSPADVNDYSHYLEIQMAILKEQLLIGMGKLLKAVERAVKTLSLELQRQFHILFHMLRPLRSSSNLNDMIKDLEPVKDFFNQWKTHVDFDMIKTIDSCLNKMSEVLHCFKSEPSLQRRYIQEETARKKQDTLYHDRQEFLAKMRKFEYTQVAEQWLRELFPDDKEFQQICKQCAGFGVRVYAPQTLSC